MENQVIQLGRQENDSLMQQVGMINEVAKRLKTVRELPSEVPTDSHPLTRVEFPDEEGVYTYMEGYDYPYKGYPYYEFVEKIDLVKKLSRAMQSGFYHGLKGKWLKWLLVPFIPTLGRSVFWACTYTFHKLCSRFEMRVNRYSQFVRELHRACSVSWADETPQITEIRRMVRDVECMILEFDNAYRFRAQDLLPELNKEALRKDPVSEITRLLDIWISREVKVEVQDSWRLLKLFTKYYLRFDKSLLNIFVRILLELDIDKCKLTVEDKYFSIARDDYKFAFMQNPNEEDKKLIKRVTLQREYDKQVAEIKKNSTFDHNTLAEKHLKEQKSIPSDEALAQEVLEKQAALKARLQMTIQQNQKAFEEAENKLFEDYLTPEQREMTQRHKNEAVELDNKYETELAEVKQKYLQEKANI